MSRVDLGKRMSISNERTSSEESSTLRRTVRQTVRQIVRRSAAGEPLFRR